MHHMGLSTNLVSIVVIEEETFSDCTLRSMYTLHAGYNLAAERFSFLGILWVCERFWG